MLNTGIRTGELLGLLHSDIDLENRVMHLQRDVREITKREGIKTEPGREVEIGKLKSTASKRDVHLNNAAIEMIRGNYAKILLRRKFTPCKRREGQLHSTRELPQALTVFSKQ